MRSRPRYRVRNNLHKTFDIPIIYPVKSNSKEEID